MITDTAVLNASPVEKPSDFGPPPEGTTAYWLAQDRLSEKLERRWIKRSRAIVRRYRDERGSSLLDVHRYNVLWSNVQTLKPALYGRTPKPEVDRRFKDQDDVGRLASMILERAVINSLDGSNFDAQMQAVVEDNLLPGRGVGRVLYIPHFGDEIPDDAANEGGLEETGESASVGNDGDISHNVSRETIPPRPREVVWEEARFQYEFWEDYREGPARKWNEVPWVRFRAYMTRQQLEDRFGPKGKNVNLDMSLTNEQVNPTNGRSGDSKGDPLPDVLKKAEIWEIWDKTNKQVLWMGPGSPECGLLDQSDDPLELPGFFPNPDPLLATTTNDTRIPVPDYVEYQDQANELDKLTARIDILTRALKVSGVYAGAEKQTLQQLVDEGTENKLIPVDDWAQFAGDKGGVSNLIQWMPIQQVAETLIRLYDARDRVKQIIWEITGMSDIMRGASNASETATAQQIKVQFGTMRLNERQRDVARFARDSIRLVANVIAGHFSPQTLSLMTGLPELKPVPAMPPGPQMIYDGQTGQPTPSPQMQQWQQIAIPIIQANKAAQQAFETACKLIKDDMPHGFRIDIEADSTIEPDEQAEKQSVNEFMGALVPLLQQIMPICLGNPSFAAFGKELTLFATRHYRVGRGLEDSLEKAFDALGQMPPAPPPGAEKPQDNGQADAQAKVASTQIATQGKSQDAAGANQTNLVIQQQKLGMQQQTNAANFQLAAEKQRQDTAFKAANFQLAQQKQAADEAFRAEQMRRDSIQEAKALD